MLVDINLKILQDSFKNLIDSGYYNSKICNVMHCLTGAIEHVLEDPKQYPEEVLFDFSKYLWFFHNYISGSTSNEIPYELDYTLKHVLDEWVSNRECVITAAFTQDFEFHFIYADIIKLIKSNISGYDFNGIENTLCVNVCFPRLFKHKPLFVTPLYHELGHFIDAFYSVIERSLYLVGPEDNEDPETCENHRAEYFADIFASCYLGNTIIEYLEDFDGISESSDSHPSLESRKEMVQKFLNGTPDPIITSFHTALSVQGAPELHARYAQPDVANCFEQIRVYNIENEAELHGTIVEGWKYLKQVLANDSEPWKSFKKFETERIINDLVEKSIRNKLIKEQWSQ